MTSPDRDKRRGPAPRLTSPRQDKSRAVGEDETPPVHDAVARTSERNNITDPQVMRALAHPTRIALMEALLRDGPLTATEAALALDESPGTMSWHLQTLAKYGFVEEAGGGKGRRRPWRLVSLGSRFDVPATGGPDISTATKSFEATLQGRAFERLKQWLSTQDSFGPAWAGASFSANAIRYLTPEELEALGDEITVVLDRYRDRTMYPATRPEGALAIHIAAFGHPLPPTVAGN